MGWKIILGGVVLTIKFVVLCCVLGVGMVANAQLKVVVIPMAGDSEPLGNVITVAKKNGDFTDPVAANNSIKDASENNPYLIVIGPGLYTLNQPLIMKEWVNIAGSGQNSTFLTGSFSTDEFSSSASLWGANHATIRDLSVENTGGGGTRSVGVYVPLTEGLSMLNTTVRASGGGLSNIGVKGDDLLPPNTDPAVASINSSTIIGVTGPSFCYGIYGQAETTFHVNNSILSCNQGLGSLESRVTNTMFVGSSNVFGSARCWNTYDENLAAISC